MTTVSEWGLSTQLPMNSKTKFGADFLLKGNQRMTLKSETFDKVSGAHCLLLFLVYYVTREKSHQHVSVDV